MRSNFIEEEATLVPLSVEKPSFLAHELIVCTPQDEPCHGGQRNASAVRFEICKMRHSLTADTGRPVWSFCCALEKIFVLFHLASPGTHTALLADKTTSSDVACHSSRRSPMWPPKPPDSLRRPRSLKYLQKEGPQGFVRLHDGSCQT